MKRIYLLILFGIVVIAATLRLYKLDAVPASLYWEEAALGYDAYSIAQTGKDFHGNALPVVAFTSFGDFKPPLYFYSVVPFVKTLGLNAWSVRLPSALAGIFTVLVVFLIGYELYGRPVGLLAAAVYAIQPWSLQLSRVGFETNVATLLIAFGVWCLVKARHRAKFLLPAAIALVLSMYAYHSERVVAPLLGAGLMLGWRLWKSKRWFVLSGLVSVILLLPILVNIRNPAITERATQTSIFSDITPIQESNRLREESGNSVLSRILYHRYVLFADMALTQYVKNFSPTFLFLDGDVNPRHGTGEFGVLYQWEFPVILAAVYFMLRKRKVDSILPLVWIGISALPVALTNLSPHTLRFASASPAFALLSGYGLYSIYRALPKNFHRLFTSSIILIVIGSLAMYLHFYYTHYPVLSAKEWQYGYEQLYSTLASLKINGQHVYVTREQGRPSMYYLFFSKADPSHVQSQDSIVEKDQGELLQVDEYYFVDKLEPESGALVASSEEKRNPQSTELATVKLPSGEIVWSIWRQP